MSGNRKKIIIDTDPGIDDAIALCYAILHPNLEIVALTSIYGNVDIQLATDNAARLCQLTNARVPIATGASRPLEIPPNPHSYFVHGDNGFGNVALPLEAYTQPQLDAADTIVDCIMSNPGQITLIAVGPLTNLALALSREAAIVENVESVVIMGGVFDNPGNVTPYAEANIWNDPHAARAVLQANWSLTILGLDVTHQVSFSRAFFDQLEQHSPQVGKFLHDSAEFYIDFYQQKSHFDGCCPHDQLALTYVTNPAWFECESATIDVVTSGEEIGRTFRSSSNGVREKLIAKMVDVELLRQDYLKILSA